MLYRREILLGSAKCLAVSAIGLDPGTLSAADPWAENELIETAALARLINDGKAPEIVCVAFPVLYRQRHIRGAKFAGPASKPEGIKDLQELAATLPKHSEVVLYCGCCPMDHCPNIRPAYTELKRMGFRTVRVLNIPNNLHNNWTTKGYPSEPPQAPRTPDA